MPRTRALTRLSFALSLLLLHTVPSRAAWTPSGAPVCTVPEAQGGVLMIPDAAGGHFVAWLDSRTAGSSDSDIYAQRIDELGEPQWGANGVPIVTAPDAQSPMSIAADGLGGLLVAWRDARSGAPGVYVQRVDDAGVAQWTPDGVVAKLVSAVSSVEVLSDDAGGAIIVWTQAVGNWDVYAQRVDAAGTALWTANGVAICSDPTNQLGADALADGAGGAFITWEDSRGGNLDIYAQRVASNGLVQWTVNGVAISLATQFQAGPRMVSDGAGGLIIAWRDSRNTNLDVYAQRMSASGVPQWTLDGEPVVTDSADQRDLGIVSDDAGGCIVTWEDLRGADIDVYAQRLSPDGNRLWLLQGAPLTTAIDHQEDPVITADGQGGAVAVWEDTRDGASEPYAQRVDANGLVRWAIDGMPLTTSTGIGPAVAQSGGGTAVVVAWADSRSGLTDIYAQRVELEYGFWGHPEPAITSVADVPSDQGGVVAVNWTASGRDVSTPRTVDQYSIWRAVDAVAAAAPPPAHMLLELLDRDPAESNGLLRSDGYHWEFVGTQAAHGWEAYSYSTATRADSVAADPGTTYFLVAAHDQADDFIAFSSNVVAGYSVDNLAPGAPLQLLALRAGPDVQLEWNRVTDEDLRDYSIYRATSAGVLPVPGNFIAAASDTMAVDMGAPAGDLYYIVTALDVHQNESPASSEALVSGTTGVGSLVNPSGLTLLPNRPNPFASRTEFAIRLDSATDVSIDVFDVAGRLVRVLASSPRGAGVVRVPFDGRDTAGRPLMSGVYFYRVRAGGLTATDTMVLSR